MWRCLLSLVVCLALCSTLARGQGGGIPPPSVTAPPAAPVENQAERPPPPLPWALAFLFTAGILVIVCMPSRKS